MCAFKSEYLLIFGLSLLSTVLLSQNDLSSTQYENQNSFLDSVTVDTNYVDTLVVPYFPIGAYELWQDWDTLLPKLNYQNLWGKDKNDEFIRSNSSLGGITYNSFQPWIEEDIRGVYVLLQRKLSEYASDFSSSSPRSEFSYLSGLARGQQVGLSFMAPTSDRAQLSLDYLRLNSEGFYRNEATDGHELRLRGYGLDSLTRRNLWSYNLYFFSQKSAENGGLVDTDYFEQNLPGIRSNISVISSQAQLNEDVLELKGTRHFNFFNVSWMTNWNRWSAMNEFGAREYYYDSVDGEGILRNRYLTYDDTTSLLTNSVEFVTKSEFKNWKFQMTGAVGLDYFRSDSKSWDAFRLDSLHSIEAMSDVVNPSMNWGGVINREDEFFAWRSKFAMSGNYQLLGWNTGATIGEATWLLSKEKFSNELELGYSFLPKMYRLEDLFGKSYDFREDRNAFQHLSWKNKWMHGIKIKKSVTLEQHYWSNLRYLDSLDAMSLWTGQLIRASGSIFTHYRAWDFEMQSYGTWKSSYGGFNIPQWGAYSRLSWNYKLGDRFELQLGMDTRLESSFSLPSYGLAVPMLSVHNSSQVGPYPWIETFANARLGTFQFGIRLINAFEGLAPYEYYALRNVPMADRWVQFAARWTLFN